MLGRIVTEEASDPVLVVLFVLFATITNCCFCPADAAFAKIRLEDSVIKTSDNIITVNTPVNINFS